MYIMETTPPGGGGISANVFGGKMGKWEEQRGKVKRMGRKGREKGRKGEIKRENGE